MVAPVCPRCGAPLVVEKKQSQVTCGYCELTCTIERDDPPANLADHKAQTVYVPNTSPVLAFVIVGSIVMLTLVGMTIGTFSADIANRVSSSPSAAASGAVASSNDVRFLDRPMLADVNHDGHLDVIGRSGVAGVMDQDFVAAFDGRTGARLWATATLSKEQLSSDGVRAVVGDKVMVADGLGIVQAYRLDSGKPAWTAKLSDKVAVICQNGDQVVIRTIDSRLTALALVSGAQHVLPADTHCQAVYSNKSDQTPDYSIVESRNFAKVGLSTQVDDMHAGHALVPSQGHVVFTFGERNIGSSIAMVAAVMGSQLLWKTLVPGVEPLRTYVNENTQFATYVAGRLVMPYEMNDSSQGIRMASFDTAHGQRLWDVQVYKGSRDMLGIASCSDTVYFATGLSLYALNMADGTQRFRVGVD